MNRLEEGGYEDDPRGGHVDVLIHDPSPTVKERGKLGRRTIYCCTVEYNIEKRFLNLWRSSLFPLRALNLRPSCNASAMGSIYPLPFRRMGYP